MLLDDFHIIGDPRIHAAFTWLLDNGSARLRWVMLIDTGAAAPVFLGFYYAEELWCGELGPL